MTMIEQQPIILVCLTLGSNDTALLRTAQQQSELRGIPWEAIYYELPDDSTSNHFLARNRTLELLSLAERMGAATEIRPCRQLLVALDETLRRYQQVGKPVELMILRQPDAHLRNALTHHELERLSLGEMEIIMLESPTTVRKRSWLAHHFRRPISWPELILPVGIVGITFVFTQMLELLLPADYLYDLRTTNSLIFMIGCAVAAARWGLIPGLIASVLSSLFINYLYIEPVNSLLVYRIGDALSLGLFLVAAFLVSLFNSQLHEAAETLEYSERRMQALLQIHRIVTHARSRQQALQALHDKLRQFLHMDTAIFMPSLMNPGTLEASWPENPGFSEEETKRLNESWRNIGEGLPTTLSSPDSEWRFEPLNTAASEIGMLAIRMPGYELRSGTMQDFVRHMAELVASILEKIEDVHSSQETRVRDEREKLRTRLLSSVSHDLKTPLASIIGSLSVHRSMFDRLTPEQKTELTETALAEAQRLDSFITNILDLAKLESGAVNFRPDWHKPEDVINNVRKRMRIRLEERVMTLTLQPNIEVRLDSIMTETALMNVIDNALKYAPPSSIIEISDQTGDDGYSLHIRDHGPGVRVSEQERIFDKYTRLKHTDSQVAGTGLGLALARAAMQGQNGEISVTNHENGGAIFTLHWRQWRSDRVAKRKPSTTA